jgi:hypothetical protein
VPVAWADARAGWACRDPYRVTTRSQGRARTRARVASFRARAGQALARALRACVRERRARRQTDVAHARSIGGWRGGGGLRRRGCRRGSGTILISPASLASSITAPAPAPAAGLMLAGATPPQLCPPRGRYLLPVGTVSRPLSDALTLLKTATKAPRKSVHHRCITGSAFEGISRNRPAEAKPYG